MGETVQIRSDGMGGQAANTCQTVSEDLDGQGRTTPPDERRSEPQVRGRTPGPVKTRARSGAGSTPAAVSPLASRYELVKPMEQDKKYGTLEVVE
jgi:hypothetical protein